MHFYFSLAQAHVYHKRGNGRRSRLSDSGDENRCSAFLANIDQHNAASVHFQGHTYKLPPWSVSILPDCQNVAYNTAKVLLSLCLSCNFWFSASINYSAFIIIHIFPSARLLCSSF